MGKKRKKKKQLLSSLRSLTSLSVFILLFIRVSSLKTEKDRERERREEKEQRRNVLITLKEASYLPTHIAECPSHTDTHARAHTHTHTHTHTHNTHTHNQTQHNHTEVPPKGQDESGDEREDKGAQRFREWENDRTERAQIEKEEWIECGEKSRWQREESAKRDWRQKEWNAGLGWVIGSNHFLHEALY